MMNRTNIVAAVGLLIATTFATSALADRVDRRQERQAFRIEQGIRDGSLTRDEAWRLRRHQWRIHREELRAKADGVLTWKERARIEAMQDRENRRIARLKHNADYRYDGWRRHHRHDGWYRDYRP